MDKKPLNCDMDGLRWAREFMSSPFAKGLPPQVDEALMLSWFANAIMCGWDNAHWKHEKSLESEKARSKGLLEALELSLAAIEALTTSQNEAGMGLVGAYIVVPETVRRIRLALSDYESPSETGGG